MKLSWLLSRVVLLATLLISFQVNAAVCTWIGTGAVDTWGDVTNWSCGFVPGPGDIAVFDGTSTTDCNIDVNIDVDSIYIRPGYTGTITNTNFTIIANGFLQEGGEFIGGSGDMEVFDWRMTGGHFVSTTGTLTVFRYFIHTGGNFDHNGGTVFFDGNGTFNLTTSDTFNILIFDATGFSGTGYAYNFTNNDTICVIDELITVGTSTLKVNNVFVDVKGDITTDHAGGVPGTGIFQVSGAGNQNYSGPPGRQCNYATIGNLVVNKAPTDTLFIYNNPTVTITYRYISGVIRTIGTLCFQGNINMSGPPHTISDVSFATDNINLLGGLIITSDSTFTTLYRTPVFNNGEIHIQGDMISLNNNDVGGGSTNIYIDGPGTQHFYTNSPSGFGNWPNVIINKAANDSLIITRTKSPYHAPFTVTPATKFGGATLSWTYNGGIIAGDGVIQFVPRTPTFTTTVNNSHTLPNVSMHGFYTFAVNNLTIPVGTILSVRDTLFSAGGGTYNLNVGEIHAKGAIDLRSTAFNNDGTGAVRVNGTGNQSFSGKGVPAAGSLPDVFIEKPSGTLTLYDTVTIEGDWTYISGTVDATPFSNFCFISNNQFIDGENGGTFHNFHKVTLIGSSTRTLQGDVGILNKIDLRRSLLALNRNDLYVLTADPAAFVRDTGFVISEDSSSTGPYGYIRWQIDNATPGNTYIYPFGTRSGGYQPFTFAVQTAGAAGGTGSLDVATYKTNWLPAINNRPLPAGVTNINGDIGTESSPRAVDRFWLVEANNYSSNPAGALTFKYLDREFAIPSNSINENILQARIWQPTGSVWSLPFGSVNTANNTVTTNNTSTFNVFIVTDPTTPDLIWEASDTLICTGDTVYFTDLNSPSPSSYNWSFPGGTPITSTTIANPVVVYNTPGTYDVTLTGQFSQSITTTYTDYITVTSGPSVALDSSLISCNGAADGKIWATGVGIDSYTWSAGTPTSPVPDTIINLTPGSYTVTVADTNGCSVIATATISEPDPLEADTFKQNVTCFGGADGKIWVEPIGGNAPYTITWPGGTTVDNDTAINLAAGTYGVTVTDDSSCVYTTTVTVTSPLANMTLVMDFDSVNCLGGNDGKAWVTISGGTPNYVCTWSGGTPTNSPVFDTITNLAAGTYDVTVEDANGCQSFASVTVGEPATALTVVKDSTNVSCGGLSDGKIWVTASGGTPSGAGPGGYTYNWSGPGGTPSSPVADTLNNAPAGTYTVTVMDANGCTETLTIVIEEPTPLVTSLNSSDVNCFGGNDGRAYVTVSGGTPSGAGPGGYTYNWSSGTPVAPDNDTVTGLIAGAYSVTIIDDNGCADTINFTIDQPLAALSLSLSSNNVTCNGDNDGTATVTVSGGTTGYDYLWSGGTNPTTNSISNLAAGRYYITVTDANDCIAIDSVDITEPTAIALTMNGQDVSCGGAADGLAYVTATGGTQTGGSVNGYATYQWSGGTPGVTPDTIRSLSGGRFYVTVTDGNGCIAIDSIDIAEPTAIALTGDSLEVSCNGLSDGKAWVTATGGTPSTTGPAGYTYAWPGGAGTPSSPVGDTLLNVPAGSYQVTVTDNNNCSDTLTIVVTEPAPLTTTTTWTNVSCNGGSDGTGKVVATGGTPSYTYAWSAGTPVVPGDSVSGLSAGITYVTVTDSRGCTAVDSVVVTEPTALTISLDSTDVSCNGYTDGTAAATVGGGTPGYTYNWSAGTPNTDGDTVTGLAAGMVYVTVTDANLCTIEDSIMINEPSGMTLVMSGQDVSCGGAADGFAYVTASGGSQTGGSVNGYASYQWSGGTPGVTPDTIRGLSGGRYYVTVTDGNGCTKVDSIDIVEPTLLVLTGDSLEVSCNGLSDGKAWVTATGGTPSTTGPGGYTYAWPGGVGTPSSPDGDTLLNVPAGSYQVTVTDNNNCSDTLTIVVTEPTPLTTTTTWTNVSCNGGNDGTGKVVASGGTPGYTYVWSAGTPIAPGDSVSGLSAGITYVTVTDSRGCTAVDSVEVIEPTAITLVLDSVEVSCNGLSDGEASVQASGGTPGFTYIWSAGTPNVDGDTVTGLAAGMVYVTVTDANLCTIVDSIEVTEPTPITTVVTGTDASCGGSSDGWAYVTASGGTQTGGSVNGYASYQWSGGTPGVTPDTTRGLVAGTYYVTVTDGNGCAVVDSVVINEPPVIVLTGDSMEVSCFGGTDGKAWVTATGGTPSTTGPAGYTYAWPGGVGTPSSPVADTLLNVPAGSYQVTVTDNNNCSDTLTIVVTEPIQLTTTTTGTNVSCNGGSDGTGKVVPTGGTPGYTYAWSGGTPVAPGDSVSGLSAGTTYVTVTDSRGCTAIDSVVLTEPAALTISLDSTDVSCNGGTDGTAAATVGGGTPGYTYNWSAGTPNTDGDTVTGLAAGMVYVTVTDANLCTIEDSILINEPTALAITMVGTDVLCNGDTNGIATAQVTGGTSPYSYAWSGGTPTANGDSIINLAAGWYFVTVTDANQCTIIDSVEILEPTDIVLTGDSLEVSCFGGTDGKVWVTATGGTPSTTGPAGYTYAWPGGVGTPSSPVADTLLGVTAGSYQVTVTDNNNCSDTLTIVVTEPTQLTTTTTGTNVSCNGGSDGTGKVVPTGGTPGYTYVWSAGTPVAPGDSVSGLSAGTTYVTVTDSRGCTAVDSVVLTEPAALTISLDSTDVSCNGGTDGTAAATVGGGTPGYTYNWSAGTPNTAGDTVTGLAAGMVYVTVTDANLCTIEDSILINEPTALAITIVGTDVLCNGDTNGIATAQVTGGTSPYTYAWSGGTPTANGDSIINLAAGWYFVTVTDANQCTIIDSVEILEPADIVLVGDSMEVSCNSGTDGKAWVTATGGTPSTTGPAGYTYAWPGGVGTPSSPVADTLLNVPAGSYQVTVTDANQCTDTLTIVVTEPDSLLTTTSGTNISCNGGNDGTGKVVATGGTPGYTYVWSAGTPVAPGDSVSGLSAGVTYVTVTDSRGCTAVDSVVLTEPAALTISLDSTDVSCNGGTDGTAAATVGGGTPGYTYNWSAGTPNTVGDTITGLAAGMVYVTVTDANLCTIEDSILINEPTALGITMVGTDVPCNGDTTGIATAQVTGGTTPYSYSWSGGTPTANGDSIITLTAGWYFVTVTDANQCTIIDSVEILEPTAITLVMDSTNVNCLGGSDGTAWVTATGGTPSGPGNTGYLYSWSGGTPGVTTDTIVGLLPGTYVVTVTDGNGCTAVDSVTITEPSTAVTVTTDSTNVSCFGGNDGTAWVLASGGTPSTTGPGGYTYNWSGGTVTGPFGDTITTLTAGMYYVTVTDANGCEAVDSINITEPALLEVDLDSIDVRCFGGSTGKAWATVTGGTSPFNYSWSGGTVAGFGDTIVFLTAGTYGITVTDANNCFVTETIVINEPTPITLDMDSTDVSCNAGSDGSAWVTATGGTPSTTGPGGYTYAWSGGTPTGTFGDTITGLTAGTYTVTVTDNNGCTATSDIVVNEPAVLTLTMDSINVFCFGDSTGQAWVTANGGTPAYSYDWSNGGVTDTISDIPAGVYYVTVTDANGCTAVDSVSITEPATGIAVVKDSSNVNCFGGNDGQAWVTVTGGTPATTGPAGYLYSWNGPAGSPSPIGDTLNDLIAGTYTVVVSDALGCSDSVSFTITEPAAPLTLTKDSINILCFGDSTGKAWVTAAGGTAPYTYDWSRGTPSGVDGDTIINLTAGIYRVTVTDTNGCEAFETFVIEQPNEIILTTGQSDVNCFAGNDGRAWVGVTGGITPYNIVWSGGNPTVNGDTVLNLSAGTYYVTVTDDNGCEAIDSVLITEPAAPLTTVSDFTDVNCFNGNDGRAWTTPSGGTAPYNFAWSGGIEIGGGDTTINLTAGTYYVTITDDNNCEVIDTVIISEPLTPLATTIDADSVSCNGLSDGKAWVTVTGGTQPYSYLWSAGVPGNTDTTFGLLPGFVSVTVTDANGCTITDNIGISQPDELLLTIAVDSNSNCYGGATGGLTVCLTGGTAPYDYEWSNNDNTLGATQLCNSITALTVGTYTVTVTDANGCIATISADIIERPGPQFVDLFVVSTLCNQPNGSISLDFTTVDSPLSYEWSHDATLNSPDANNLMDGTYTVTISDNSQCDTVMTIVVPAIDRPVLDSLIVKQSYCEGDDGRAVVQMSGGVPPYTYAWSHDTTLTVNVADSLVPGTYSVTVADANACDTVLTFNINEIDAPELIVDPLPTQTIYPGQSVAIEVQQLNPIDSMLYAWTPLEDIDCGDCLNPNLSPEITTTYILVGTDQFTGCTDTLYYTVIVKDENNIFVPNAITPNGDGVNDVWNIRELEIFPDNEVIILNRWGDEIYRAAPYLNDWDGTYNGNPLPAGTYYYILKLDNISEAVTGPITIVK